MSEKNEEFESRILFIDLETTGLDARVDVPLELAVTLTDGVGTVLDSYEILVWEDVPEYIKRVSEIRNDPNDFVNKMHTESGLWDSLDGVSDERSVLMGKNDYAGRDEIQEELIKELHEYHNIAPKSLPIAGLSIGSLDRPFLQRHFPRLNNFLSHRNIDISSIREICKRVNPELQASIEKDLENTAAVTHRAAEDCRYSIDLYQEYIEMFFVSGSW